MTTKMMLTAEERQKALDTLASKSDSVKYTSVLIGDKKITCSRGPDDEWQLVKAVVV